VTCRKGFAAWCARASRSPIPTPTSPARCARSSASRSLPAKSDQDIRDFLVARYGDFVLLDPPFKGSTYVLWIGPFAILVLAAIGVAIFFRRRAQEPARVRELSVDEHSRVVRLLQDGPEDRA